MSDYRQKFRESKRTFPYRSTVWWNTAGTGTPNVSSPGTIVSKSEALYSRGNPWQLLGQDEAKASERVYRNAYHGLGDIGGNFLHAAQERHGNVWDYPGTLSCGSDVKGWQTTPFFYVNNSLTQSVATGSNLLNQASLKVLSDANLDARGATLIARADPTKSQAEAAQTVVELFREGIPSVIPSLLKGKGLKGSAGDYLSFQFGWKPLVSDVEKLYRSVKLARVLMEQFERDSGKVVRRRRDELKVVPVTTTTTAFTWPQPTYTSWAYSHRGWLTTQETVESHVWFSGAFQYYFSEAETWAGKLRELEKEYDYLFGLSMNVDTLWELTAWSWLIDWVTNAGDVVSNVSTAFRYGNILKYGYVMQQYSSVKRQTHSGCVLADGTRVPDLILEDKLTVKKRRRANPFGFGVSFDGLSNYQMSILVALGISRRR